MFTQNKLYFQTSKGLSHLELCSVNKCMFVELKIGSNKIVFDLKSYFSLIDNMIISSNYTEGPLQFEFCCGTDCFQVNRSYENTVFNHFIDKCLIDSLEISNCDLNILYKISDEIGESQF